MFFLLGLGSFSAASAATLQFDHFAQGEIGAAQNAMSGLLAGHQVRNHRIETFEGHRAWDGTTGSSDPRNTAVGHFSTLGGRGTGGSAVNGGRKTEVRGDAVPWGRYSTDPLADPLGRNWLDTNDTSGLKWDIGGIGKFNAVAFFLTDVADVGARFSIKVGDTVFSNLAGAAGRLGNGNIHFVSILLPEAIEALTVELRHDRLNDGFGIDGAMTANLAPVPVPPALGLLGIGLAALFGIRRRSRPAA